MFVRKFVHMFVGVFVVRMIFETATFCDLDAAVATFEQSPPKDPGWRGGRTCRGQLD